MNTLCNCEPTTGIMKIHDFESTKVYKVVCSCGCENQHTVDITAEYGEVTVTISTKQKTNFWVKAVSDSSFDNVILRLCDQFTRTLINSVSKRVKLLWNATVNGYIECDDDVILSKQQALTYANALILSIENVKPKS